MMQINLTGLNGTKPLDFMCSLGIINIVSDLKPENNYKLTWIKEHPNYPIISDFYDENELVEIIKNDIKFWRNEPNILKILENKNISNLKKIPVPIFKECIDELCKLEISNNHNRTNIDMIGAFGVDIQDKNKNMQKTWFDFTAGQQSFVKTINLLINNNDCIKDEKIKKVLFSLRENHDKGNVLWETGVRSYAYSAFDPAKSEKFGNYIITWLAFRGLPFFTVIPNKLQSYTTSIKKSSFKWVLWDGLLNRDVIRTIIGIDFEKKNAIERETYGILKVLKSEKKYTGKGYGYFSPSLEV